MSLRGLTGLAAATALSGCVGTSINGNSTGVSTGSSTASSSGGSAAAATSGGTTSAAAGSTGTSSGGASSTSTGVSSGGSSTGSVACGAGLVWAGDQCRPPGCADSPVGAACVLPQGAIGTCSAIGCVAANLQSDPNNCGLFGLSCPPPTVCLSGRCFDPASGPPTCKDVSCGPEQVCFPGFGCVLSYSYCGEFGTEGEACLPAWDNDRPGTCCGEGCARLDSDRYNCGRCGVSCDGCENGTCFTYPSAPPACNGINNGVSCSFPDAGFNVCCDGACVDLESDTHCDACEIACPIGSSCFLGVCLEPGDGGEASCASTSDCPPGHGCRNGRCLTTVCGPGDDNQVCSTDAGAPATCCNGTCADLDSDPDDCGLCGLACGEGQLCVGRKCVSPAPSCQTGSVCALHGGGAGQCCGSRCVDLRADPDNCGECGEACPIGSSCNGYCSPDGGAFARCAQDSDCPDGLSCAYGSCQSFDCDGGATNCAYDAGGTAALGTCCGLTCVGDSDPNNCQYCNEVCPGDGGCDQGDCIGAQRYPSGCGTCPSGTACVVYYYEYYGCFLETCGAASDGEFCAFGPNLLGTCCGGRCVNSSNDPSDCGGCGQSCSSGVCYLGDCAATQLSAPCNVSCPIGTTCEFDQCLSSVCTPFTGVCGAEDGTLGVCCPDGACAHLLDDPQNCGGCGLACPAGQTCADGACSGSPACGPAQADGFCNLDGGLSWVCCPGSGCTNTALDAQNCGACGAICPAGKSCSAGGCR